jgi:hypothetical protein
MSLMRVVRLRQILRLPFLDVRQNFRHDLPLRLRALRAAVAQTHVHRAGFHFSTADGQGFRPKAGGRTGDLRLPLDNNSYVRMIRA